MFWWTPFNQLLMRHVITIYTSVGERCCCPHWTRYTRANWWAKFLHLAMDHKKIMIAALPSGNKELSWHHRRYCWAAWEIVSPSSATPLRRKDDTSRKDFAKQESISGYHFVNTHEENNWVEWTLKRKNWRDNKRFDFVSNHFSTFIQKMQWL